MKNLTFVPKTPVTHSALREFVSSNGGKWHSEDGLNRGVFEEGDKAVYVDPDADFLAEYGPEEQNDIRDKVAQDAPFGISVFVSHAQHSEELLERLVKLMNQEWGGIVLDCGNTFNIGFGDVEVVHE